MLLTSIDPFFQEFERRFDRFARQAWGEPTGHGVMPMDVIRRNDEVLLRLDVPGIDPDSIEVTVDRGVLTVSGRRDEETAEEDRAYVRERVMGTFTRRVTLSEHLDADGIEAAYSNGVLAVRIPYREEAKPRKIQIRQSGKKAIKGTVKD